jgi:hypothetical protein
MDLFGLDKAHAKKDMEVLTTTHDDIELAIVCDILEGEEIPFLTQDRGTGNSVRIIMGHSLYGTDVFVHRDDLARAQEILEAYRNAESVEETEEGEA